MNGEGDGISYADYVAGKGTKDERAEWERVGAKLKLIANVKSWQSEAERLLAAAENQPISKIHAYIGKNPPTAGAIAFLIVRLKKQSTEKTQGKGGAVRSEKYIEAKALIAAEWNPHDFKSKREFADMMVKRIQNEFNLPVKATFVKKWIPKKS